MRLSYITSIIAKSYQNNCVSAQKRISYNISESKSGICSDIFVKEIPFTGSKAFTIEWYKNLTKDQINIIDKKANNHIYSNKDWLLYDKNFNKNLRYHDILATGIKDSLNNKFGVGKYIVIPTGRSLSSVGKCLGYKIGEDSVKPLPMSSARRFLDLEKCKESFAPFTQYLESIKLSKENVETSGKHYIFIDYCNTGFSMQGVKKLFESDKIWGHQDNVHFENVFNLLKNINPNITPDGISAKTFLKDLESDFISCRYKQYSLVKECPRFHYLENAVLEPEDYDIERQVFYWKLLMNEMNRAK